MNFLVVSFFLKTILKLFIFTASKLHVIDIFCSSAFPQTPVAVAVFEITNFASFVPLVVLYGTWNLATILIIMQVLFILSVMLNFRICGPGLGVGFTVVVTGGATVVVVVPFVGLGVGVVVGVGFGVVLVGVVTVVLVVPEVVVLFGA